MANKTENGKKKSVDKPRQSRLIAEPHVLEGKYCNAAALSHTKREFVLDFIFQLGNEAHLVSRILTNPPHAKAILDALRRNVESGSRGSFTPSPHTTQQAGPHWAVHRAYRAVAG
jgi:hypothetical protein